ncbi:MAG: hypothetical protein GX818_06005 [Tissierellia bacterium]|nr:hypothetical protein [Tissierellia bacterium]
MKKIILIITIFTLLFTFGCTRLPVFEKTGVRPAEYEGIVNTGEIKKENSVLKEELDEIKAELEELQKEYLSLAKSNENIIFKLEEAESKLLIVEREDIPKFNAESTDKNSIISYLKDSSKLIDDSIKGIEIISFDNGIVFRTVGYGKEYSQIFIWDEGEKEPVLIDGAVFDKEGSYEWLGKYLLIRNSDNNNKVLDIENKKITGSFDDPQKLQLLEGTTTILLKDDENNFILYDFVNDSNKQINLDNNKYTDFNLQNGTLVFLGTYVEENVEYEMRASFALDKLMEVYEVKSAEVVEIIEGTDTEAEEAGEDTV